MRSDGSAVLQDGDGFRRELHLHGSPPGAVRHGIEIAGDRHHAVASDAALQGKHAVEGAGGNGLRWGRSSAKCSATTRWVVACRRRLAIWSSHWVNYIMRLWPSTMENSQTIRSVSGSSVKVVLKKAKSTWPSLPGGVSNRRSKDGTGAGRTVRTNAFSIV